MLSCSIYLQCANIPLFKCTNNFLFTLNNYTAYMFFYWLTVSPRLLLHYAQERLKRKTNFCNVRVETASEICDEENCRKQKAACLWLIWLWAYMYSMGTICSLCIVIRILPGATLNDVVELPSLLATLWTKLMLSLCEVKSTLLVNNVLLSVFIFFSLWECIPFRDKLGCCRTNSTPYQFQLRVCTVTKYQNKRLFVLIT